MEQDRRRVPQDGDNWGQSWVLKDGGRRLVLRGAHPPPGLPRQYSFDLEAHARDCRYLDAFLRKALERRSGISAQSIGLLMMALRDIAEARQAAPALRAV